MVDCAAAVDTVIKYDNIWIRAGVANVPNILLNIC
jgi:protein-L-isoaspartate O-methyltransferase